MKRISEAVPIVFVVGFITFFIVYVVLENSAREKDELAKKQQAKKALLSLANRYNAIHDWKKQLCGGQEFRYEEVMTVELQNLWLTKKPILWIGDIRDVSKNGELQYLINLSDSLVSDEFDQWELNTAIELSLVCPKGIYDTFIKNHKDHKGYNSVAVIAKIESIASSQFVDDDDDEIVSKWDVKIGNGKLIDIQCLDHKCLE